MSVTLEGLFAKYRVEHQSDPAGKHDKCPLFVLDVVHDPHARAAVYGYIKACQKSDPKLAADLQQLLDDTVVGE